MRYNLLVKRHNVEIFSVMPIDRGGLYPLFTLWWAKYEWPYLLFVLMLLVSTYYGGLFFLPRCWRYTTSSHSGDFRARYSGWCAVLAVWCWRGSTRLLCWIGMLQPCRGLHVIPVWDLFGQCVACVPLLQDFGEDVYGFRACFFGVYRVTEVDWSSWGGALG